ncbi:hypothetical protein [Polaromonas sp.]|uniref:hypothetical protein n=1 Tax=Polaromonas sp. TaxID=1869339 RepID=UPI0035640FFA
MYGVINNRAQTMSDQLNVTLALAKQAFDELLALTTFDELDHFQFATGPKLDRIVELLNKLNRQINDVDRTLSELVSDLADPPLLSVPPAHRNNYYEIVVEHGPAIQRAHLKAAGLGEFLDILETTDDANPKPYRLQALAFALERWRDSRDNEEGEFEWMHEWYERGFNIDGAIQVVQTPWFQPDRWAQNLRLLRPVLIDRRTDSLRDLARHRLTEVYRAFTFGLWLAAIALSRSLVEYAMKANASRLGIELVSVTTEGRREDKSLWDLQQEVSVVLPSLSSSMETVRFTGNRILHPSKHDVMSHPVVLRSEALSCVLATKQIVEALYSQLPEPTPPKEVKGVKS